MNHHYHQEYEERNPTEKQNKTKLSVSLEI